MKILYTLELELPDTNMSDDELHQELFDAIKKTAQLDHLASALRWGGTHHARAGSEIAVAYHRQWADIIGAAKIKIEKA